MTQQTHPDHAALAAELLQLAAKTDGLEVDPPTLNTLKFLADLDRALSAEIAALMEVR